MRQAGWSQSPSCSGREVCAWLLEVDKVWWFAQNAGVLSVQ
jgi:hypothetical protein